MPEDKYHNILTPDLQLKLPKKIQPLVSELNSTQCAIALLPDRTVAIS
ncbi:hypothetical protein QUB63_18765 [Microcoleus sp. ARI1-B5]